MIDTKQKSRLDWNDTDWAAYLGCSVQNVAKYRELLEKNYLTCVEQDKKSGLHAFALYKYDIAPSGTERLRLMLSSKRRFNNVSDAVKDANNIISTLELSDFWAGEFNVPKQAVQMLLIRQK